MVETTENQPVTLIADLTQPQIIKKKSLIKYLALL